MKTFLALSFASVCGAATGQTPAANPMPDGSRDLYVGVGAASTPDYPGARARRVAAVPLIQMAWSGGVFISGMSVGMHLSRQPSVEFGPLLALHPSRDQDGEGRSAGGITEPVAGFLDPGSDAFTTRFSAGSQDGLTGMDKISARVQGGGFFNGYLTPSVRITSNLLYGAGAERHGLVLNLGLQRVAAAIAANHKLAFGAGVSLANRSYHATYFGVQFHESVASGYAQYEPGGGVKDVYLGAGWNWALSPSWMVTSGARVTRLMGDARHSPLVQRPTNVTVTTGIAYRF